MKLYIKTLKLAEQALVRVTIKSYRLLGLIRSEIEYHQSNEEIEKVAHKLDENSKLAKICFTALESNNIH